MLYGVNWKKVESPLFEIAHVLVRFPAKSPEFYFVVSRRFP